MSEGKYETEKSRDDAIYVWRIDTVRWNSDYKERENSAKNLRS